MALRAARLSYIKRVTFPRMARCTLALIISRRTVAKIRQNLFWAFADNVAGIPLAALGLLSPVMAGAAMALSSVSVMSSALLLKRWPPPQ